MRAVHTSYPPGPPLIDVSSLTAGLVDVILPIGGKMMSLGGAAPLQSTVFADTTSPTDAVNFRYKAPVKVYVKGTPSYSLRSSAPSPFAISGTSLKECTLLVLWKSDSALAATSICFGYGLSSSANPIFGVGVDATASHPMMFVRDTAGTGTQSTAGTSTIAASTEYLLIGTRSEKNNFHRVYSNGVVDVNTTATAIGTVSFDRTTLGALQRNTLGLAAGGQVALALCWNRALTPSEAISISANPWQIFANPAAKPWGALVAAGGVTFNPGWAQGATRTIGAVF